MAFDWHAPPRHDVPPAVLARVEEHVAADAATQLAAALPQDDGTLRDGERRPRHPRIATLPAATSAHEGFAAPFKGAMRHRRGVSALGLQPWQWGVIGGVYVALFLVPAVWMWRRARRDDDAPLTWALLVALGSFLGVLEYYHHRSILRRRARRQKK